MTRLIDRILERAPGLAETLLGDPSDPGLPLVVPVVVAGDAVFPRAAAAVAAGSPPMPTGYTPRWPMTFVESTIPPGLTGTPCDLPAPTAVGWMFMHELHPGGALDHTLAALVVEADAMIHGPVAILALEAREAGRADDVPEFVMIAGSEPGDADRDEQENRVLRSLYLALVTLARVNDGGPGVRLVIPDAVENEGRVARGLAPLLPFLLPPSDEA